MSIVLGCLLGSGALLAATVWLWPRAVERPPRARSARLQERLIAGGLPTVSPLLFIAVSVTGGLVVGAVLQALVRIPALSLTAACGAAILPSAVLGQRLAARRRAHRSVWPDVVDHLVSSVRAGRALPDALAGFAEQGPSGVRPAFAEFDRDYRRTGDFGAGIDRLKQRLADPSADRILETLRMARQVGGTDLTAVLRSLSAYLRQEAALRQEATARQAWIRNTARLGVAAPWIILLLLASRPEAIEAYNSAAGGLLIVIGAVVSVIAYRLMLRAGRLAEEGRWFT